MKYLTLALLLAAAAPAAAQTARIAHFSHGGSLATLDADAAADNFGIVTYFTADSAKVLSDSTVLEYGKWHGPSSRKEEDVKTRILQVAGQGRSGPGYSSRAEYSRAMREYNRQFKLIGDTTPKATNTKASPTPPVKAKAKRRCKESALVPLPTVPGGPAVPGGLLLGAGVLLLAGAGWLLTAADKRPLASA